MRSTWWGGLAAISLCWAVPVAAEPVDCGPAPTVKCLATEVFLLAKTLPADEWFRRHVAFAEQRLAPGDIKTALEYVVSDNADPVSWEDIEWMARAGRFEPAITEARQRKSPVERLGGLLAVAAHLLDKNDQARAQKIVEDVDRQLPSMTDDTDEASLVRDDAGELWARLGQTDRAARLISGSGINSVSALLAIAGKYPVAAGLREQALREAERVSEPYAWQLLVEDAIKRGDQAEASRLAQRAGDAMDGKVAPDRLPQAVSLARILLTAEVPAAAARLIKPWPQWLRGKDPTSQSNIVTALIPVLAGLAREQDIRAAVGAVSDPARRSECLTKAAEEYFRLGRSDLAEKFETEALALAKSSPTGDPKLQWAHDAALDNLALARAGRGDMLGALDVASELEDEAKIHEATASIARRAIDSGRGAVAGPAIEALQQQAAATQNAHLLLLAASDWHDVDEDVRARQWLEEAIRIAGERHSPLDANDLGIAAELMWRIDGKGEAQAMPGIVDKLGVTDPNTIDHLVEIIGPISPAVAIQLAGRQVEVERRIDELASIGVQLAANAN